MIPLLYHKKTFSLLPCLLSSPFLLLSPLLAFSYPLLFRSRLSCVSISLTFSFFQSPVFFYYFDFSFHLFLSLSLFFLHFSASISSSRVVHIRIYSLCSFKYAIQNSVYILTYPFLEYIVERVAGIRITLSYSVCFFFWPNAKVTRSVLTVIKLMWPSYFRRFWPNDC